MARSWIESVRSRGTLTVYAGPSLRGGSWAVVLRNALRDFNALARQHRLGVTLTRSDSDGAEVLVETATDQISFSYDGTTTSEAFSANRLHGRTFQVSRDGYIEKAYVFLPGSPQINTPRGLRSVGSGVMQVIAVHELVHACGLHDSDHSTDDLFQGNPQVDYGRTAARDRVTIESGGRRRGMPPLVLSGETVRRIKALW